VRAARCAGFARTEVTTNDADDVTYTALNDAALVISGNRVAWSGRTSRAPAADRAGRTDLTNTPRSGVQRSAMM